MNRFVLRAVSFVALGAFGTGCGGILGITYLSDDSDAETDATTGPDAETLAVGGPRSPGGDGPIPDTDLTGDAAPDATFFAPRPSVDATPLDVNDAGAADDPSDASGTDAPIDSNLAEAALDANALDGAIETSTCADACASAVQPMPDCGASVCVWPIGSANSNGVCCPTGQTGCAGVCVNELIDNANCGGCGLACNVGCSSGRCLTTLASGQTSPGGIAVDSTSVYWTTYSAAGTVMRVPLSGGTAVTLASGQANPSAVAVDATSVYWTNFGTSSMGGGVWKMALSGGTPISIASMQYGLQNLVLDSANIYWTGFGGVWKAPLGGGPPTLLAAGASAFAIAVSERNDGLLDGV